MKAALVVVFAAITVISGRAEPFRSGQIPAGPPPTTSQDAPPPATGLILGRVLEAGSDSPVSGAAVTLSGGALGSAGSFMSGPSGGGGPRHVVTDGEGNFLFRDLPKGTFQLSASAPDFVTGSYGQTRPTAPVARVIEPQHSIDLGDGEHLGNINVQLWKQGTIGGRVTDEAGEPMVNVQVSLLATANTWGGRLVQQSRGSSTDDRGMYAFSVTPGDYLIAVLATVTTVPSTAIDDYQQATTAGQAASRAYQEKLSASGAPFLGGNGLRVGDLVLTSGAGRGLSVPAPSNGERLFLYPTTYYPSSTSPGSATAVSIGAGEVKTGVDLQLTPKPTYRVSGTVSGAGGPVAAIGVRLIPADASTAPTSPASPIDFGTTITDGAGRFTFLGVTPGSYSLRVLRIPIVAQPPTTQVMVSGPGGGLSSVSAASGPPPVSPDPIQWALQPLTVEHADIARLDVVLQGGARVNGRLLFTGDSDRPGPEGIGSIMIAPRALPGTTGAVVTAAAAARIDGDGQFTTSQYAPGKYVINVSGIPSGWMLKSVMVGSVDAVDVPVDLGPGDLNDVVVTLTDKISTIGGIARQTDEKPASSASVIVFSVDTGLWPHVGLTSRRVRTTSTGRDGRYSFGNLAPGSYYVAATDGAHDFTDPKVLTALMQGAARVTIGDGDKPTQDLHLVNIK